MVSINALTLIKVGLSFSEAALRIFSIPTYRIQNHIIRVNSIFLRLREYDIDYLGH